MKLFIFYIIIFATHIIYGKNSDSSFIQIPYSSAQIEVDGSLSDWDHYYHKTFSDTLTNFNSSSGIDLNSLYPENFDFSSIKGPISKNIAEVMSFWNRSSINFAIIVYDKHLYAEISGTDEKPMIHLNDGIEIYIDTRFDSELRMDVNDYQFLIDIKNNYEVFRGDHKQIITDTIAVPKDYDQNILFSSRIFHVGSINDSAQIDSLYIVEVTIPFAAIGIIPSTGNKMKMDICVNDIDYHSTEGNRIEEASSIMWSFNWVGLSDFGFPATWRNIVLTGGPTWYEKISEEYKSSWFWIYLITLGISALIVSLLLFKTYKLKQLPNIDDERAQKIIYLSESKLQNEISYNQSILNNASDYICNNLEENITSEQIANNLGISLRSLQRITKEEMQITPTNYIYLIKLKLAAEFLANKQGNVTDAAYKFGFSDPSYFSKLFKKHFGVSPKEYQNN